jgi:MFS family permease
MTPTTVAADSARATDMRVIALVSAAHFVSHVYIFVLPPLFLFVRADFGVSFTELGVAVAIFNVLTAVLQTPAGFLVDRVSARAVLVGALLLGPASLAAAAFAPSFYVFVALYALLGVANSIYHPADYAILSHRISAPRMGKAYSIHIFAGYAGTAAAPATLLLLAEHFGWRGAFGAAALIGLAVAVLIMLFGAPLTGVAHEQKRDDATAKTDWRLLLSAPVMLNLVFFILIAVIAGGIMNYGIVALDALWGTPLPLATSALTVYLVLSAFAVLVGGFLASRTDRHDLVAMWGLVLGGAAIVPIALFDLDATLLIGLMALSGFFNGLIQPSRDMLVRAVTPPGSFGKVFGFVTTGFNIGGIIAPPVFGYFMDHQQPRVVLLVTAFCALAAIPTVMATAARSARRVGA